MVVLDGFGLRDAREANAIRLARTPTLDRLFARYPWSKLDASGLAVGLPAGQMGNSEVGHLNIGAGRVVYQDLVRITRAIESGEFFANAALVGACDAAKAAGGRLHVMGLCSDGGVHSTLAHGLAVIDFAKRRGVPAIAHAFLDGRDTPPRSAAPHLRALAAAAPVATVSGRYFAMDRDQRWDRVELAWRAIVHGEGGRAPDAAAALDAAYARGESDEFVRPMVIEAAGVDGRVRDGDAVVFTNFRADRARQMTRAFAQDDFDGFPREGGRPRLSAFVCMTEYDRTFGLPVAFPPQALRHTLGEVVAEAGLSQLRTAETEKYAHVTYFFNGGREAPLPGEERTLVASDRKVATYDEAPEMSAPGVTRVVVDALRGGAHAFVLANFANPDMVGHTGKLEPAIRAVECVDRCLGEIARAAAGVNVATLVTADHGNCELMVDPATGQPHTAHTLEPVPLIAVDEALVGARLRPGRLCDVAPTALDVMGLSVPHEMEGRSLLDR